jgi:hypothetical protein
MDTPTRRDLLKYAVGATLASALPASAQNHRDTRGLPLVVDLIGPMAFEYGTDANKQNFVDVWLPHLEAIDEHEAGIVTPGLSYPLAENSYTITGPSCSNGKPQPCSTSACTVYPAPTSLNANRMTNRFIRLTMPMPSFIAPLHPVQAKVYLPPTAPTTGLDPLATGLRFVYDAAGTVVLTVTGSNTPGVPFDFAPTSGEKQLHMSIEYNPFNSRDLDYTNAINVFTELAVLFLNERLKVNFKESIMAGQSDKKKENRNTPLHPCRAPVILQT